MFVVLGDMSVLYKQNIERRTRCLLLASHARYGPVHSTTRSWINRCVVDRRYALKARQCTCVRVVRMCMRYSIAMQNTYMLSLYLFIRCNNRGGTLQMPPIRCGWYNPTPPLQCPAPHCNIPVPPLHSTCGIHWEDSFPMGPM